jgi:hypothetical protein
MLCHQNRIGKTQGGEAQQCSKDEKNFPEREWVNAD